MEDFERRWSAAVYGIDSALRSLSPDFLLAFGAICSLVAILSVRAWLRAIRRNKTLKLQIRSLTDELAAVKQKNEIEVLEWRVAANKVLDKQPAQPVQSSDQVKWWIH